MSQIGLNDRRPAEGYLFATILFALDEDNVTSFRLHILVSASRLIEAQETSGSAITRKCDRERSSIKPKRQICPSLKLHDDIREFYNWECNNERSCKTDTIQ